MRLTIMLPMMNLLRQTMSMIGLLKYNTSPETQWMVIDNASIDPVQDRLVKYIKPKRLNYVRNEVNPGLIKNNQYAYENCETELLCLIHNDTYVYEKDWDKRIISYFKEMPRLGMAGFFGAQGCHVDGGRMQDVKYAGQMSGMSNMLEAEIHGMRLSSNEPWRSCAIYDSFCMVYRMDMLRKAGGFDQQYKYHHYYDRDSSLESLRQGYNNIVVNVPCHHVGGQTGEDPKYQDWVKSKIGQGTEDGVFHNDNKELFMKKWAHALPLYVNDDFSFRSGRAMLGATIIDYKGNAIVEGSI